MGRVVLCQDGGGETGRGSTIDDGSIIGESGKLGGSENRGIATRGAGSGRDEIDGNGRRTGGYAG